MKVSRLIFVIASIIIGVWLLGLVFRFAAWLINGLLYVAAIVVIVGLIAAFIEQRKNKDVTR
jgi:predicted MFS family arabinose efflux permease